MNPLSRFVIKNLLQEDRYLFLDLFSDFKAVLDREGMKTVQNVFGKKGENLIGSEEKVLQSLVQHGILQKAEDLVLYKPPELRNVSLLFRVEIEITQQCNLSCLHCFTEKSKQSFDIALLKKNLPELEKLGVVEIILNGGEMFLHREITEIISLVSGRFKVILYSNGTLPQTIEIAAHHKIARLNISLDGFKESHEYLRGPGTYEKTVRTIRELTGRGIAVQINSVVYPKNSGDLEDFIQFCRDSLKVQGIKISPIYPLGQAILHPELRQDDRFNKALYEKYFHEEFPTVTSGQYLPCLAGITKLYIDARGDVYPCRLFEAEQFRMGSLNSDLLGEIYNHFVSTPHYFTQFDRQKLVCKSCPALAKCKTGCRARAYVIDKNLYAPDAFACKYYLE